MMNEKTVAFSGETMLLNWAESNTRGRTVTFLLGEEAEAHPFRDSTVKSGKKAGQRYMMVLVQINDDETVVERTPSQLAFLLCKDPAFWHWATEHSFITVDGEESARQHILETCKVKSRGDLDKAGAGHMLWQAMIWQPFNAYRDAQKAKAFAG